MAYGNLDNDQQPILRDYLAAERTSLANERTLLAYLRTALMMLATALTIFKLFESDLAMKIAALVLGPSSILTGAFGIFRFRQIKAKLAVFEKSSSIKENAAMTGNQKSA